MLIEKATDHLHINAGIDRCLGRFFVIRGDAVIDQLLNGGVVADHEAIELPFIAQDFGKRESICGRGHDLLPNPADR